MLGEHEANLSFVWTKMITNSNILGLELILAMLANNSAVASILYTVHKTPDDDKTNPLTYRVPRRLAKALTRKEVKFWFKMNTDSTQLNRFLCWVIHSYNKIVIDLT